MNIDHIENDYDGDIDADFTAAPTLTAGLNAFFARGVEPDIDVDKGESLLVTYESPRSAVVPRQPKEEP